MHILDLLMDDATVRFHYEAARTTLEQKLPETFQEAFTGHDCAVVESPIEAIFVIWWEALTRASWRGGYSSLYLQPQVPVSVSGADFRLDFEARTAEDAVLANGRHVGLPPPAIAIELDGHAFHEKTKEQVTQRNQRDRLLQQAGWKVLHVSGSELVRQPAVAVGGVLAHAGDAYREYREAVLSTFEGTTR